MSHADAFKNPRTLLIYTQVVDEHHPILGFFIGWITAFAKDFARVEVIAMQVGEYDLPDNVTVSSLGKEQGYRKPRQLFNFYWHFARIYFTQRPQYVFLHMGAIFNILAAPFFLLSRLSGPRFYWWKTHGHINATGRVALWFVDRVYTAVETSFPVKTKKRHVVGHAIDTELFTPGQSSTDSHRVLFVGRVSRSKRIEEFIDIVAGVRERGREVSAKVIGTVADETYLKELTAQVAAYNLQEVVEFVPGVPHGELVTEYQQAAVFINPSSNDGLDKVVLEAALCGAVPLSGNLSFTDFLGEFNLFIPRGDVATYVDKVVSLLGMKPSERQAVASGVAAKIKEEHALVTLSTRIFQR